MVLLLNLFVTHLTRIFLFLINRSQTRFFKTLWGRIHSSVEGTTLKETNNEKQSNPNLISTNFRKGKRRKLKYSEKSQTSTKGLESQTKVLERLIEQKNQSSSNSDDISKAIWKYAKCCRFAGERSVMDKHLSVDPSTVVGEVDKLEWDTTYTWDWGLDIDESMDLVDIESCMEVKDDIAFFA